MKLKGWIDNDDYEDLKNRGIQHLLWIDVFDTRKELERNSRIYVSPKMPPFHKIEITIK